MSAVPFRSWNSPSAFRRRLCARPLPWPTSHVSASEGFTITSSLDLMEKRFGNSPDSNCASWASEYWSTLLSYQLENVPVSPRLWPGAPHAGAPEATAHAATMAAAASHGSRIRFVPVPCMEGSPVSGLLGIADGRLWNAGVDLRRATRREHELNLDLVQPVPDRQAQAIELRRHA